jgi:phenylalanyl-tRNA synthetase alpha chain
MYTFIFILSLFSKKNINFARKFDLRHYQDTMLVEKIDSLRKEVEALTASNAEEIEALRLKYLSKKGELNALMTDFRSVPADQKK